MPALNQNPFQNQEFEPRYEILEQFCLQMEKMTEWLLKYNTVVDPGQYLYDCVRQNVKSREDYVLQYNTLSADSSLNNFLLLGQSISDTRLSCAIVNFVVDYMKELKQYAVEMKFIKDTSQERKVLDKEIRDRTTTLYSNLSIDYLKMVHLSWTGFVIADLTALAQEKNLTLEEFLGPETKYDTVPIVAYVRTVVSQFNKTAKDVLTPTPSADDVSAHMKFLADLLREAVLLEGACTDIKEALLFLAGRYFETARALCLAAEVHDAESDNELRCILGMEKSK